VRHAKAAYSRSCDRCLSDCGLDPAALRDLTLLRFAPGEFIVREGVPIAYLLFVVSGRAKACLTSAGGGDLILCYYVSEGILGDAELMLDSRPAISTTIAVTEFTCVGVPLTQNAETLKSNLAFVNRVGASFPASWCAVPTATSPTRCTPPGSGCAGICWMPRRATRFPAP
jgi:CRP-like cAMP-binding protein